MSLIALLLVSLVALLHLGFCVLEMFLWEHPVRRRVFGHSAERARQTRVLAANKGLYNGFLAAGLVWGLLPGSPGQPVLIFFLGCVLLAGVYGAVSASVKILWLQAFPAAIALAAVVWSA